MKSIRERLIYFATCAALGIVFYFVMRGQARSEMATLGIGLFAGGTAKFIQYAVLARSPQKLAAYNLKRTEERTVYIAQRSGLLAYRATVLVEVVAAAVLALLGREDAAQLLCLLGCGQMLVYSGIYWAISRKS